ncbi:MAG: hypothetical protein K6U14_11065 [Firmicutes bacterium]|nr:hypothetical protein [Alicyclobacillaceae bacterium]MCL6498152.1 hypothetical protein [Bacillota bacterium]
MRGSGWVLAAQVANLGLGLGFGVAVARTLGPRGQGLLALALLPLQAWVLVAAIGGSAAITFLLRRGRPPGAVLGWAAALGLAVGGGAVLLLALWPGAEASLKGTGIVHPWALALWVPASVWSGALGSYWLARGAVRRYFLVAAAPRAAQLGGLGLLWAVHRLSVGHLLAVAVTAPWTAVAVGIPAAARAITWSSPVAGEALAYGMRGHWGNVSQFLNYRLNLYLVGRWDSAADAGRFWLVLNLAELLWYLPAATAALWFPAVAGAEKVPRETAAEARRLGWLGVGMAAAMAALAPAVIPRVWGPGYRPAVALLWAVLPGAALFAWSKIWAADLAGRGHPQWGTWSSLAGLAVVVIVAVGGGAKSPLALAAGQSISYAVSTGVLGVGFRRLHPEVSWRALWWSRGPSASSEEVRTP